MKATSGKDFAVITGASSGIGYELARVFAAHDFDLDGRPRIRAHKQPKE